MVAAYMKLPWVEWNRDTEKEHIMKNFHKYKKGECLYIRRYFIHTVTDNLCGIMYFDVTSHGRYIIVLTTNHNGNHTIFDIETGKSNSPITEEMYNRIHAIWVKMDEKEIPMMFVMREIKTIIGLPTIM